MTMTIPEPCLQAETRCPTILVVDDDPANLSILSNYLKDFGFRVTVARDGESALEKAEYGRPDLILLDLLMPKLDGYETCRLLKTKETLRDIPVIFMTGLAETKDKVKGFQAGGVDYIIKPFQYEEVLARIKTHLDLHLAQKQLEMQNTRLQLQISERERAEEALRQSRQELNEAQRLARVGSWVWEPEQDVVTWSEEIYHIFGCDPALPAPKYLEQKQFFSAENWKRLSTTVEKTLQTGTPYELDLEMIRADGQRGWITARGEVQRDANGRIVKLCGTAQDITERKRAEVELRWNAAFLETLVHRCSIDGILVVDSQGRKVFQNQRMADLWEIPPSFANDRNDERQLQFVMNQTRHPQQFLAKVEHLYSHPSEICRDEIELKNGKVLDRYSAPVIDKNGRYYGRIWTFRDITKNKQAENALKKAHDVLEQRVEERTAELKIANEQLQQSNRLLHILSEFNEQVVRATQEQELLQEICRIILGTGGYPAVWIGFAGDDPDQTVRPVAQKGFEEGYLEQLTITWADTEFGRGPAGSAIRLGKPCIVQDVQTDAGLAPWRKDAIKLGFASVVGLPLRADGRVFGSLTIYSRIPNAFTFKEMDVLMELADDLAYGIMSLRTRAEHQHAEEQLHRLADLQSAILNNTNYTVISTDEKGIITSINPAGERSLGYTAAECVGKLMPTTFHDPDEMAERARIFSEELGITIEPGFEVFAARARRNLPNEYEWIYIRKDGSRFPVLLSVTALRNSQGNIVGFLGIANDITRRKQAEAALRDSRHELNEAQRIATVGSWVWEVEPDIVIWSEESYHMSGRDPALPVPTYQELHHYYTPESWERLRIAVERALQTGTPYQLDLEMIREDGQHRWTTARGEALREASGRIVKLRGTSQDITERKWAEEALHRSEQKFSTIFHSSPVALAVSELETGRFVEINEAFLRLVRGISFDQVVGRTSLEIGLLTLDERKKMSEAVRRFGHVDRLEIAAHRLDGEPTTVEVSLSRYEFQGKNYLLTNVVDITDRKQAREEIQRLNIGLEKRVAERTAELAAANRELETFSYSASHDLRSPLRIISSFGGLLKEEYSAQLPPEALDYVDRICTATARMDQLINGLLNLSHISRTQIRCRPVDLSALARTVAAELHEAEPQRVVQFVIAFGLRAEGDPDLLRSVLQNLLGNAWKYTGKHARARIEFGAEQAGDETVFYVRDDGAGFAPENAGKLFNVFQRLHGPEEFPGTGIGLTIVQRIIQRHGGRIWANGVEGKGATFYFTIPSHK